MRYFIANLAVHLIILAALTVFACIFASRNRKRKTKHVISYFFPILFALVAIIDIVLYTAPRLLDINSMINSNYYYTTGTVEKIGFLKNYFIIDGNYYYLNPLHNNLNESDLVRVKHTPFSSFTVEMTKLSGTEPEPENNSSEETEN
ncbi:MAG: hypothetical protein IJK83_12145 [Clostridiales bacterium]|nr:hypothetical protein [Clostridiales bacterium]